MIQLRDYQQRGVDQIREAFGAGYRSPLYVLPTGGGKTAVYIEIAKGLVAKQNKGWILTHRDTLMKQIRTALSSERVPYGMVNPNFPANPLAPIQLATIQTAVNRLPKMPKNPALIVNEEGHHAVSDSFKKFFSANPDSKLLGVTASPIRTDGQGLGVLAGGVYDILIMGPQISELIEGGYLKKVKVFAPSTILDLSDVKTHRGDFEKTQLEARLNKKYITGDAIAEYKKHCDGLPAIAFCVSVAHAEAVAREFTEAGYAAASIDGKMTDEQRRSRIEGLADGSLQVLTSCDLISEGVDIPAVCVSIVLRPTMSLALWIQICGRPLRLYPGQDTAYILDHAGNTLRHGLPDQDREWSLNGNPKPTKKNPLKAPNLVHCKNCLAITKPCAICPQCGSEHIRGALVTIERGGLEEITQEDLDRISKLEDSPKEKKPIRSLEDLQKEGRDKKYKAGWAYHKYQAQFKEKA